MDNFELMKDIDERNKYIRPMYTVISTEKLNVERYLESIIEDSKKIEYNKGLFEACRSLAIHYVIKDEANKGFLILERAKKLIDEGKLDESNYAKLYNSYMVYYIETFGDLKEASNYYQLGMKYAKKYNNTRRIMHLKGNFAVINLMSHHYGVGIELLSELEAYFKNDNDEISLKNIYANMGDCYLGLGKLTLSKEYFAKAYKLSYKYEDSVALREASIGLSKIFVKENNISTAITILDKAIKYARDCNSKRNELDLVIELSQIYFNINSVNKAYDTLIAIKDDITDLNCDWVLVKYYKLLSEVSISVEAYKEACFSHIRYHELDKQLVAKSGKKDSHDILQNHYNKTISRLKTLAEIGRDITSLLSLNQVVEEIINRLKSVMNIDSIAIGRLVENRLEFNHLMVEDTKAKPFERPLEPVASLSTWVVKHQEELFINDIELEYHNYTHQIDIKKVKENDDKITRSIMYAPLMYKDEMIGVFTIQSYAKNAYSTEEYEIFRIISSYVSVALHNAIEAESLIEMSLKDSLTGLYNRRGFIKQYEGLISNESLVIQNSSMIMLDVDDFKSVNDTYGHIAGDLVLSEVGKCLRSLSEESPYISRLGGEEFAMILVNKCYEDVIELAEKIRKIIEEKEIDLKIETINITTSIGIGYSEKSELVSFGYLYQKADEMMYMAKEMGKNQVVVGKVA